MTNVEVMQRWATASQPTEPFRQPPHNVEAEQALLGAILVNNEAFDRVSDFLLPDPFLRKKFIGAIYEVTSVAHPGRQDRHTRSR